MLKAPYFSVTETLTTLGVLRLPRQRRVKEWIPFILDVRGRYMENRFDDSTLLAFLGYFYLKVLFHHQNTCPSLGYGK